MKSFLPSLYKFILGMFLFGLAFFANPIEGFAYDSNSLTSSYYNGTTWNETRFFNNSSFNVTSNGPLLQYGLVPFSSFDLDIVLTVGFSSQYPFNCSGYYIFDVDLLFSSSDNAAYSKPLGSFCLSYGLSESYFSNSLNTRVSSFCDGVPTGIRVTLKGSDCRFTWRETSYTNNGTGSSTSIDTSESFGGYFFVSAGCDFSNFNLDQSSSGGSSSTIINNTSSNLVPIGYSSLNFGLNGSTYFLGASRIFEPSYLSPLMFSYDFANSPSGVVSSAPLTLAMGGYDSPPNTLHASPIAVIGDTRAGEYELTIALCLTNSPSSSDLLALTNLSNWGFEFNRGYSGQQFSMPSNARISYTNFTDSKTGYVYTSVYFYFTTPDYFDSFLIRKAPTLSNIRVGAFAFNKYTGTISDQLNQSDAQWTYDNPSHSSFTCANSSASSTVSAFSSIESDAFSNLDTAMSGAGVNDFNINVISTPLATVSAMINQTYNILPDLVKWLILAILVIGIFAVIISANNYVNKD